MVSNCEWQRSLMETVPLSEEEEDRVLASIEYSRKQLSMDLATFREWISSQEHLPPSRLTESDDFLISFLVGCKGSLEKSKKKFDRYYTLRRKPFLFDRSPSWFLDSFDQVLSVTLPNSFQGYRLSYIKFLTTEQFDLSTFFRRVVFFTEVRIRLPGITAGDCVVMDCELVDASIVPALLSPTVLRDASTFLTEALPNRCLQYYLINCSSVLETVVNRFFKPLLSKKISERFTVTSEGESLLHAKFPKELIPAEYGGDAPSIVSTQEAVVKILKATCDEKNEFLNRLQELTDESKRPSRPSSEEDESEFGVQGSIKYLSID